MPWKYNGQLISDTTGFSNTDGYMSPKNWVTVWDSTEKTKQGVSWEDPTTPTLSDEEKLGELRNMRNAKLQETDYLANSDVTMPDNIKTWRQSLRDLPQNNTTEEQYDATST